MSYIQAKKRLKQNQLSPLYLLFGTETFMIDDVIQHVIEIALTQEEREMNLTVFELKETPIQLAIEEAQTLPFFGAKKVVVLKDAYFFTGQKAETKIEHDINQLEKYMSQPAPETIMLIQVPYPKLDERKKITKLLKEQAEVVEASPFDDKTMGQWLDNQAAMHQTYISPEAKTLLVQRLNGNLLLISNEIAKLSLYVKEGATIHEGDVSLLVARTMEQDVFALIDCFIKGNMTKGLEIMYDLLKQKEEPIKIIALLARQFRILYQVKEMSKKGYAQKQIASQVKLHPYVVKLACAQSESFSDQQLLGFLQKLAGVDYQIKSGKMEKVLALEMFVLQIHPTA